MACCHCRPVALLHMVVMGLSARSPRSLVVDRLPKTSLLIIEKGFGGGTTGTKWNYLQSEGIFDLHMPSIPEFIDDSKSGLNILREAIDEFTPDILVASSRGSKYAAELVLDGSWSGPTFLISPTDTFKLCTASNGSIPVSIAHGTRDRSNRIQNVRLDVYASHFASLEEFEDGHSLSTLCTSGKFVSLLMQLRERFKNEGAKQEWKLARPDWVKKVLDPKMSMEAKQIKAALAQRKRRQSMLDAMRRLNAM